MDYRVPPCTVSASLEEDYTPTFFNKCIVEGETLAPKLRDKMGSAEPVLPPQGDEWHLCLLVWLQIVLKCLLDKWVA